MASESSLLALALTGEELPIEGDLLAGLETHGWDAARLQDLRRARQVAGQPWPHPVPAAQVRAVGFARFDAQLSAVRRTLGLDGLIPARPAARRLNADEVRLSAERPPHW